MKIQKFDSLGNFIIQWGSFGTGNSEFISPSGIAVSENEFGQLSINSILDVLAKEGFCKILIEGGAELLNSFNQKDLIDEVYVYTSNNKLKNATLKNPLIINDTWNIKETLNLGDDNLIIATKKELCLQES